MGFEDVEPIRCTVHDTYFNSTSRPTKCNAAACNEHTTTTFH